MVRIGAAFLAVLVATFAIHEAAHALAGLALGFPMLVGLNHAVPAAGVAVSAGDAVIIDAAGPAVTILGALLAVLMLRGTRIGFLIVVAALVMRAFATSMSAFTPNDEMRLSTYFGLNPWLIPALVTAGLVVFTLAMLRGPRLGWRGWVGLYLGGSVALAAVVGLDRVLPPVAIS